MLNKMADLFKNTAKQGTNNVGRTYCLNCENTQDGYNSTRKRNSELVVETQTIRTFRKNEECRQRLFSSTVMTIRNDKPLVITSDSRKLNNSRFQVQTHTPNIQELRKSFSVEITSEQSKRSLKHCY